MNLLNKSLRENSCNEYRVSTKNRILRNINFEGAGQERRDLKEPKPNG